MGVRIKENHWYEHVPNSVETTQGGKITILWNQQVQTDRTIPNNKPDIIIRDTEQRTCILIDVAISGDRNVIKKEAEKKYKYKDLTIETQRMWNVKTTVIPVIIGTKSTLSKSFRKYVDNIPAHHELRKTTIKIAVFRSSRPSLCPGMLSTYFLKERHCTHPPESADVEELQN